MKHLWVFQFKKIDANFDSFSFYLLKEKKIGYESLINSKPKYPPSFRNERIYLFLRLRSIN